MHSFFRKLGWLWKRRDKEAELRRLHRRCLDRVARFKGRLKIGRRDAILPDPWRQKGLLLGSLLVSSYRSHNLC